MDVHANESSTDYPRVGDPTPSNKLQIAYGVDASHEKYPSPTMKNIVETITEHT